MTNSNYDFLISRDTSIVSAMKLMDKIKRKLLIVTTGSSYLGLLSAGDIQRAIINNFKLTSAVSAIMRNDYIVALPDQSLDEIKKLMLRIRAEFMPVVDANNNIINIYFWEDLLGDAQKEPLFKFELPVVIMAGGKGTRLKPLTNVIPKPLIPIDNKTIIEHIFNQFNRYGCNDFYISVYYKASFIEYYLKEQQLPYKLIYFKEEQPLGTAGSLSLLKDKINNTFFVTNCDILIDQDYSEILRYHRENRNEITIVVAMKYYPIPYGIIESGKNGKLEKIIEKPELTFKINSGMYILEPHLLKEIPENTFFHITELIDSIKKRKGMIGVFPLSEKSWTDIGDWDEYFKVVNK